MKKVLGWFILIICGALLIGLIISALGVAKTLLTIVGSAIFTGLVILGLELIGL